MHRRAWCLLIPLGLVLAMLARPGWAQDAIFATSEANPTQGPREIADGVIFEPVTSMRSDPRGGFDFDVGARRITIKPSATLDRMAIAGREYRGPVQYYVERGVMTVTATRDNPFGYSSDSVTSMRIPADGEIDVPADVAVYVGNGKIGTVRNDGDEPLVILAIVITPDPSGAADDEKASELVVSPVPGD